MLKPVSSTLWLNTQTCRGERDVCHENIQGSVQGSLLKFGVNTSCSCLDFRCAHLQGEGRPGSAVLPSGHAVGGDGSAVLLWLPMERWFYLFQHAHDSDLLQSFILRPTYGFRTGRRRGLRTSWCGMRMFRLPLRHRTSLCSCLIGIGGVLSQKDMSRPALSEVCGCIILIVYLP